jgi:N-acetylneuraminate synthase
MLDIHSKKPLIILEFANNHMGSYSLFKAMVDDFALVAKDYSDFKFAIKLQYRDLDSFVHKNYKGSDHPGIKRFESTNVSFKEWSPRIDYAISKGFAVGCTPFDEVSVTEVLNDKRFSF